MSAELRVTVSDTATVFSGPFNLHRFDAPSPRDIAAQIRSALGPDTAGARVRITAEPGRAAQIEAALAGSGIAVTCEELPLVDAPDPPTPELELHRPASEEPGGRDWAAWAVAAVVAAAAAACAVAVAATTRALHAPVGSAPLTETTVAETPASLTSAPVTGSTGTLVTEAAEGASASNEAPPRTVVLQRDGLHVELPAGFSLEPDGELWRATGLDPDFRLEIAVDELYNLPPETLAEQLRRDLEADPGAELVAVDGQTLTYRELPGDGSEVLWRTWPAGNRQIFVGCHTRTAPTQVQQATCRMAMDSASYRPVS